MLSLKWLKMGSIALRKGKVLKKKEENTPWLKMGSIALREGRILKRKQEMASVREDRVGMIGYV